MQDDKPDAKTRLTRAAIELYACQGFDQTTVAEIAAKAGVTERTYFRQFTDKREVLFDGSPESLTTAMQAIFDEDNGIDPVEAATEATERWWASLGRDHARASARNAVIVATPTLQERELLKFQAMSTEIAKALVGNGYRDPGASIIADIGVSIFRVAFGQWANGDGATPIEQYIDDALQSYRQQV